MTRHFTDEDRELEVVAAQNVEVLVGQEIATITTVGIPRIIGSSLREHILVARSRALRKLRDQGFQVVDTDRFDDTRDSSCFVIWDQLTTIEATTGTSR